MTREESDRQLTEFIQLGRKIIAWDRRSAFGLDFNRVATQAPSVELAQPGFMGPAFKGLVVMGLNPGSGDSRPGRPGFNSKLQEWNRVLRDWRDSGTRAAYDEAFQCWLSDLPEWRVWTMYVEPLLSTLGFTASNIAYLNFFQSPTIANSRPTPRMFTAGWSWTKQQLKILQPKLVLAGGKDVGKLLESHWRKPPFEVLVQDRNRSLTTEARTAWISSAASEITRVLGAGS